CGTLHVTGRTQLSSNEQNYHIYGNSGAHIHCVKGYEFPDHTNTTTVKCLETGAWSTVPTCQPKDCGTLHVKEHTYLSTNEENYHLYGYSGAHIQCDTGYEFPDHSNTTTVKCLDTGVWSNVPLCQPKDCGTLHVKEHTNLSMNEKNYHIYGNSGAHIQCDTGYQFPDHSNTTTVKCFDTGVWSNVPLCQPKDCGKYHVTGQTQLSSNEQNYHIYGNSGAHIHCVKGYEFPDHTNTTTVKCLETGVWSTVPTCQPKVCGTLHVKEHTNLSMNEQKYHIYGNSGAHIQCDPGYEFPDHSNTTIVKCLDTGVWSNVPLCQPKDCGTFHVTGHTQLSSNQQNYHIYANSGAHVHCVKGYEFPDHTNTTTVKCLETGAWSTVPTCQPKDCGTLHVKEHTNLSMNEQNYHIYGNSGAHIQCDTGYEFPDHSHTTTVKCLDTGVWSNVPLCQPKDCGTFHVTGHTQLSSNQQNYHIYANSGAHVHCVKGYEFPDHTNTTTVKCLETGAWSTVPTCQPKDCGTLHVKEHTNLSMNEQNYHIYGNSGAHIQCDTGYEFPDHSHTTTVKCLDTGVWSNVPLCQPKDCGTVNVTGHTQLSSNQQYYHIYGNSGAHIHCVKGYEFPDHSNTATVKCLEIGAWSTVPTCQPKDCGTFHVTGHTQLSSNEQNYHIYGNSGAHIHCVKGYEFPDHSNTTTVKCLATGAWSTVTTCQPKDCGDIHSSISIRNALKRRLHNDTKYSSTAEIDCDEGYFNIKEIQTSGISTTTIRCSEYGTWMNIPTCVRKDCGNLDMLNISNAKTRIVFTDTKYQSNATISCETGYTDQNKHQTLGISTSWITCSANGTWANVPHCERKDNYLVCGNVHNISINYASNRRLYNDTIAETDCDEGYYNINDAQTSGISTATIRCSENGTWVNMPACVRKDCGKLDQLNISNAKLRLTFGDTKYKSSAAISCDTGYTDKNKPQTNDISTSLITCSANGTWAHVPKCVRKDCGNVHYISINNAANRRLHNDTKYTSTADIDCDEGYYDIKVTQTTGKSTTTITCSDHGTWVNIPTCERKECGGLSELNIANANDRIPINGTKYNSIANISCDVGYKERNKSQTTGITSTLIRCYENGTWANQPTCVRK
ncbi:sushi, von Willebrand factor type A, EGF and pentraxin domain-containing protein 1-like, partial [Mercenaria mercenaria]|uniref:sushi, von Willebrand factor type A, EGF and pentraxin domain-containing protein 1-like n=1 Tax=Mercenaria mercenaria TaxID=6596 RepID=UPI00234F477D